MTYKTNIKPGTYDAIASGYEGKFEVDGKSYRGRFPAGIRSLGHKTTVVVDQGGMVTIPELGTALEVWAAAETKEKPVSEPNVGTLVLGFPGVGKTVAFAQFDCLDSDSSNFEEPDRFTKYADHIEQALAAGKFVLGSTHRELRDILDDRGIRYVVAGPALSQKELWLSRLARRKTGLNSEGFLNVIRTNWEPWVTELQECSPVYFQVDVQTPDAFCQLLSALKFPKREL